MVNGHSQDHNKHINNLRHDITNILLENSKKTV